MHAKSAQHRARYACATTVRPSFKSDQRQHVSQGTVQRRRWIAAAPARRRRRPSRRRRKWRSSPPELASLSQPCTAMLSLRSSIGASHLLCARPAPTINPELASATATSRAEQREADPLAAKSISVQSARQSHATWPPGLAGGGWQIKLLPPDTYRQDRHQRASHQCLRETGAHRIFNLTLSRPEICLPRRWEGRSTHFSITVPAPRLSAKPMTSCAARGI